MYTLAVTLMLLTLILLYGRWMWSGGWDFRVYCASVRAYSTGQDPYLGPNLQSFMEVPFAYVYPVASLPLFRAACALGPGSYLWLYSALLLVTMFLVRREVTDWPYFTLLLFTGLAAVPWNYRTGNVGILELTILALVLMGIRHGHWWVAAVGIGLLGFLKILPLAYAVVFLIMPRPWVRRLREVGLAILVALGGQAASWALEPSFTRSFFLHITGRIPGQESPVSEKGASWFNPTLLSVLRDVASQIMPSRLWARMAWVSVYFGAAVLLGWLLLRFARWHQPDPIVIFSAGILVVMLLLPRLKPYTYSHALIPLVLLTQGLSKRAKLAMAAVACVVPAISVSFLLLGLEARPPLGLIAELGQLYALLSVTLATLVLGCGAAPATGKAPAA